MTMRFLSVSGYVNRETVDGRMLEYRHNQGLTIHPAAPVPLLYRTRETAHSWTEPVGRIDFAGVIGLEILLTGIILEDWRDTPMTRDLAKGRLWMNLDVDHPGFRMDDEKPEVFPAGQWRVRAATVHGKPAWNLPPVLLWSDD